ncbi:hypothetical protein ETSB_1576 [cyanobacterium endosymbiont of Epithemia turgida isolate EtSB Lake Yunoko]|nr:hypothetical protein ETSB_1576 [cyanobacterium endosymbiont of Epithemia turgida isolate EtSB Lake Yunoko]
MFTQIALITWIGICFIKARYLGKNIAKPVYYVAFGRATLSTVLGLVLVLIFYILVKNFKKYIF